MGEREIGKILQGIDHLNKRYGDQEGRIGNVEKSLNDLVVSFASQPGKCLSKMEEKFVTKEKFEPVEDVSNLIKKSALLIFCSLVTLIAVVFVYLHERLL